MIEFKRGDILCEDVEALVNAVNCVGVMGRGLARQFKQAFAQNFTAYAEACQKGEVQPGKMFVHRNGDLLRPYYIVNFPTKRHWSRQSLIEDIDSGMKSLVGVIGEYNIRSIAIPPLGCGLGGLDWGQVKGIIEAPLKSLDDVKVVIFEPLNPL